MRNLEFEKEFSQDHSTPKRYKPRICNPDLSPSTACICAIQVLQPLGRTTFNWTSIVDEFLYTPCQLWNSRIIFLVWSFMILFYFFLCFRAKDPPLGLELARQALFHWVKFPTLRILSRFLGQSSIVGLYSRTWLTGTSLKDAGWSFSPWCVLISLPHLQLSSHWLLEGLRSKGTLWFTSPNHETWRQNTILILGPVNLFSH